MCLALGAVLAKTAGDWRVCVGVLGCAKLPQSKHHKSLGELQGFVELAASTAVVCKLIMEIISI
jgi:hypothetical protein